METFRVTREDVVNVATSVGITLTEKEIDWLLLCYEDAQRQDPTGTWNLVVEDLAYQAVEFRRKPGVFDQLGYEQTHPEPGDSDFHDPSHGEDASTDDCWFDKEDLPPINNFHSDGDGDDTLLNFMG